MLLGTAECPWSPPLRRKEWLSCHQKSFGRGCDHPELSRVTFTMRRRRAGCCRLLVGTAQAVPHLGVTALCHHQAPHLPAPSTNPGLFHSSLLNSLALFKLLQLFQLLQLGLSNRSIFFKKIDISFKGHQTLRFVLFPQHPPASLGGCTSTPPVSFGCIPPSFGCSPPLSVPAGSTKAAGEDGSE